MRTAAPGDGGIAQKTPEPDSVIFYSVPTSFFTVDSSIPRILRDLYAEAEGCHKSGFLTGASACIRKVVYELAVNKNAEGGNYEDRIKSLKQTVPDVDGSYFDVLLQIQKITSTKVHESSYDGWQGNHVKAILQILRTILHEIYVVPKEREDRYQRIAEIRDEVQQKERTE